MKRVLFVDDEPLLLNGLRRALWDAGPDWKFSFSTRGELALDMLAREKFDIIVSDLRMPGMSGDELLEKVKRLHPEIVRIVLSGHSDPSLVMKSVKPAHQYLAKPCDHETLLAVLRKAAVLSEVLGNKDLAGLVSQLEALPAMSETHHSLMLALEGEDASLRKVGEIVGRDMGMSATVIKLVNSSFFGLGRRVSNPIDAVSLLGLDVVKGLALSVHVFAVFDRSPLPGFSFEMLWRHSMNTAGLGKSIAQTIGQERIVLDEAYVAGLMHDLGKLVLAVLLPVEYNGILELVRLENRPLHQVEKQVLGCTHGEIGAYLVGLWGLSESVMHALAYHHHPSDCPVPDCQPLLAVHVANYLEHELCVFHQHYAKRDLDRGYVASLGHEGKASQWLALGKDMLRRECENG